MQIDTHSLIKELERVKFSEEQAEAIMSVFMRSQTIQSKAVEEIMVTSTTAIKQSESAISLVQNVKEKVDGVATKEFVKAEIADVRAEIADVRAEIADVRAEIKGAVIKICGVLGSLIIALKVFDKFI